MKTIREDCGSARLEVCIASTGPTTTSPLSISSLPTRFDNPTAFPPSTKTAKVRFGSGPWPASRKCARDGGLTRYLHDPEDPDSLSDNDVFVLLEDSQGALWVGTRNGLNRFDRQSGKFASFRGETERSCFSSQRYDPRDPGGARWQRASALDRHSEGALTSSTGDKGTFVRYTIANGLRNDYICGLLGDDRGTARHYTSLYEVCKRKVSST